MINIRRRENKPTSLGYFFSFNHVNNNSMNSSADKSSNYFFHFATPLFGLLAIMAAYAFYWSVYLIRAHENFSTYFNLAYFEQPFWNLLNGFPFPTTLSNPAQHLSPLLLIFLPLYAIYNSPIVLLTARVFFISLAAIPAYFIVKGIHKSRAAGVIGALLILLNPLTIKAIVDGYFNAEALAIPVLLAAFAFLEKEKPAMFFLTGLLACLVKEDMALTVAFLGIYVAVFRAQRRTGVLLAITAMGYFFLATGWIIPGITGEAYRASAESGFDYLGSNPTAIAVGIFQHPMAVLQTICSLEKITFIFSLFASVAFLAVFAWQELLVGLPVLGILLLSQNPAQSMVFSLYSAPLAPILFYSAVKGWQRLELLLQKKNQPSDRLARLVFALILGISVLFLLLVPNPEIRETSHTDAANRMLSKIPPTASVAAAQNFLPHLAQRRELFDLAQKKEVDYVVLETNPSQWIVQWMAQRSEYKAATDFYQNHPRYQIIAEEDGIILYHAVSQVIEKNALGPQMVE